MGKEKDKGPTSERERYPQEIDAITENPERLVIVLKSGRLGCTLFIIFIFGLTTGSAIIIGLIQGDMRGLPVMGIVICIVMVVFICGGWWIGSFTRHILELDMAKGTFCIYPTRWAMVNDTLRLIPARSHAATPAIPTMNIKQFTIERRPDIETDDNIYELVAHLKESQPGLAKPCDTSVLLHDLESGTFITTRLNALLHAREGDGGFSP